MLSASDLDVHLRAQTVDSPLTVEDWRPRPLVPGSVTARALFQLMSGHRLVRVSSAGAERDPDLLVTVAEHLRLTFLGAKINAGTEAGLQVVQRALPWAVTDRRNSAGQVTTVSSAPRGSGNARWVSLVAEGPYSKYLRTRSAFCHQVLWVGDQQPPWAVLESFVGMIDVYNVDIPAYIVLAGA